MSSLFCKKVCQQSARRRIEGYLDRLYGYAFSLTHNQEQARDLVQTCALKALAAKRVPRDEPAYRSWLFKILRNAHLDEVRREREDLISLEQCATEGDWDGKVVPLQFAISNDDALIDQLTVQSAMDRLSRDHHEIMVLIDMLGFSYREAADLLSVPVGTVMSRVSRARQLLLDELHREKPPLTRLQVVGVES